MFADWWGSPVYISEDELVIKGVKGWSMQSVKALLTGAIGTKLKPNIKWVGGGNIALAQFRNKEECEEALPKRRYIKNPMPGGKPEWLTCSRAKAKRSFSTIGHEKEVADAEKEWNTQNKKEQRTKDNNYPSDPGSPSPHQEEETIAPADPTPAPEEEPENPAFWTDDQADTAVPDETFERIETLRTRYPEYWKKLMEIELPPLSDAEALADVRAMEKAALSEKRQERKTQEEKKRSRRKQAESDEEEEKGKKNSRNREFGHQS